MLPVETQAEKAAYTYNISPNGACGDWYWEVLCSGNIVARGLAATQVKARVKAIRSARAFPADRASHDCTLPQANLWGT